MNVSMKSHEILNNVQPPSNVQTEDNSILKRIENLEESKKAIQADLKKVHADEELSGDARAAKAEGLEEKLKSLGEEISKARLEESRRVQNQMQAKIEEKSIAQGGSPSKEQEKTAATVEFMSKVNYQIHTIHTLRRTKSELESQIHHTQSAIDSVGGARASDYNQQHLDAAANSEMGAANQTAQSYHERIKTIDAEAPPEPADAEKPKPSQSIHYKTGAAISGYKTYKSDQPKAWDPGDVNELR